MVWSSSSALRVLFLCTALPALLLSRSTSADAQTTGIVCFGLSGGAYTNNSRCPGSNACCGVGATCLSNRLCHNPNDGPELWVRGPCAVSPWDDSCGQICLYNETEFGNGVLPRVVPCNDGSLCCNQDPQCCQDRRGVFLDENGNVVKARVTAATTSYPPSGTGTERFTLTPLTSTTSTSTTSASSTPSSSTTGANSPANSQASNPNNTTTAEPENTAGLKVGLGVGIPLAVLASGGLVYFLLRRRKTKADSMTHELAGGDSMSQYQDSRHDNGYGAPPPGPPSEMYSATTPPKGGYYSGGKPAAPAELGSPGVAELGVGRRYELS
ncbi:hypothetical protein B0T25DRAFT_451277 [Lasiosphaeria hispida]|uniref:Mid2 domain-containing protein n=1 Tax=Lasiosphaeria hispida TaxID=260671 RepID=A0AAJ0HNA9_9PEZI|nr:hypothetical protein B0T25DRAFT_451277 [Lasiosphaeria hispida]